jgi:hypothetical protein
MIGEYVTETVFSEDFESGLPAGWTTTGLWHVTGECVVDPPCNGVQWAYYGQDTTCDYETGGTNEGSLTSAPITLPTLPVGGDIELTYCYNLETESSSSYDLAEVYIGGQLLQSPADSAAWNTSTINLNNFAGQTVTIEFRFDTVDGVYNEFHGWQVDLIEITSTDFQCNSDCPADVNGDGAVDVLDLLAVLAAWGNAGGPEDVNGDGAVNVLDLLEVLSAWGPCA